MKRTIGFQNTQIVSAPLPENDPSRTQLDVKPSQDELAQRAYFIYLQKGCPQGRALEHWLEAEAQTIKSIRHGIRRGDYVEKRNELRQGWDQPVILSPATVGMLMAR